MALTVTNLTKSFGDFHALKGVSLSLKKGEIFALVGPNGAGKTTLVKSLVGLQTPTSGSIVPPPAFGYVPDNPVTYDFLTGYEFLLFAGRVKGLKDSRLTKRVHKLVPLFKLEPIIDQYLTHYSRGNKQKIAYLAALLNEPDLLIIDEPLVGLDPQSIKIFAKSLQDFAKEGGTVLFTTHILSFAQEIADRGAIMSEGKIVKELSGKEIRKLEVQYSEVIT